MIYEARTAERPRSAEVAPTRQATAPLRRSSFAYDATPPVLSHVAERSATAADVLSWQSSSASDRVIVQRRVRGHKAHRTVFDGVAGNFSDKTIRPGAEYLYSVQSVDQAANLSKVVIVAAPPKVLMLPDVTPLAGGAEPILRWRRFRGAALLQRALFRGSKRVYSAWPTTHHAGLPSTWKWYGHRFRLTPGRYRCVHVGRLQYRSLARYRFVGSAKFASGLRSRSEARQRHPRHCAGRRRPARPLMLGSIPSPSPMLRLLPLFAVAASWFRAMSWSARTAPRATLWLASDGNSSCKRSSVRLPYNRARARNTICDARAVPSTERRRETSCA